MLTGLELKVVIGPFDLIEYEPVLIYVEIYCNLILNLKLKENFEVKHLIAESIIGAFDAFFGDDHYSY